MMNAECISMSSGKHQTITDTCYIVRMKLLTNQGICFRFFMGSFVCPVSFSVFTYIGVTENATMKQCITNLHNISLLRITFNVISKGGGAYEIGSS